MKTPALDELISGYFHADWDLDGSTGDVVNHFLEWEPTTAKTLVAEIDALLASVPDDGQLEILLKEKGCAYEADPIVGGYRAWLQGIALQARDRS